MKVPAAGCVMQRACPWIAFDFLSCPAGHSLGGALATLAAYDIKKQLQEAGQASVNVLCYSFGAPRTGNHAFAKDYNQMVPDTWSIINDQVGGVCCAGRFASSKCSTCCFDCMINCKINNWVGLWHCAVCSAAHLSNYLCYDWDLF